MVTPTVPAAPTALTATAASPTQVNLSWTDNATNETGYKVARAVGTTGAFTLLSTLGAGATSFIDTTAAAGTQYTYEVCAYNSAGDSTSCAGSVTTPVPTPVVPAAPTALAATATSTSQISLAWTDNSTNETGYKLERATGTGAYALVATLGAGATSYSDSGLAAATQYSYRVYAYNSGGNSAYSNVATASTMAGVINQSIWSSSSTPAIASVKDTAVELGVKFSSTTAGYITGLRFYKGSGNTGTHVGHLWNGTGALLATATFTGETASGWQQVTFATPVAIAANTTYVASYYAPAGGYSATGAYFSGGAYSSGALTATNSVYTYTNGAFPTSSFNNTNYWVDVNFTTAAPTITAPAAPSALTATANSTTQVTVKWTDNSINETGFYIERSTAGGAFTQIASVAAGATSYINTGLTAGTAYSYRVRAYNSAGASAYSNSASATTLSATVASIWTTPTPSNTATSDKSAVELGLQFKSDVNGYITGVRFYKASTNTGTHVANLWDSSGKLLASATFTAESASGWQTVTFASPVYITAGTVYTVSYHTNVGNYSYNQNYFTSPFVSGHLTALTGVYGYGSTSMFPTSSYLASNYWVDVLFTAA